MNIEFKLGNKVRYREDNGWGSPGCVIEKNGAKLRIFWPDENRFSTESACDLVPYGIEIATQPEEVAA